jgi:hypothetical protein
VKCSISGFRACSVCAFVISSRTGAHSGDPLLRPDKRKLFL